MQIHRSRHSRGFTVLPNSVLQDRRLSYTARGLLADLLSRPDGWREDGRKMADTSPQGRHAVAKALRELAAFGHYVVERVRHADGTFTSEAHVYDLPRGGAPSAVDPGPGRVASGDPVLTPVKNREKQPTLPAQRTSGGVALRAGEGDREQGSASPPPTTGSPETARGEAAALLHRVTAKERRLRLGEIEALELAPLVTAWLERGHGPRALADALLGGLPQRVRSPQGFVRDRLTRKLPPVVEPPAAPSTPRWHECTSCGRPTADEGKRRLCVPGRIPSPAESGERGARPARGPALVRAALRGRPAESDTPLGGDVEAWALA